MDVTVVKRCGCRIVFELPQGYDGRTEIVRMDDTTLVASCPDCPPVVLHLDTSKMDLLRAQ